MIDLIKSKLTKEKLTLCDAICFNEYGVECCDIAEAMVKRLMKNMRELGITQIKKEVYCTNDGCHVVVILHYYGSVRQYSLVNMEWERLKSLYAYCIDQK